MKYQKHYNVWNPRFDINNFDKLISEIGDGLE